MTGLRVDQGLKVMVCSSAVPRGRLGETSGKSVQRTPQLAARPRGVDADPRLDAACGVGPTALRLAVLGRGQATAQAVTRPSRSSTVPDARRGSPRSTASASHASASVTVTCS